MPYLAVSDVQDWLKDYKHSIATIPTRQENLAIETLKGKLAQRYDTTTWLETGGTPSLVLTLASMLVAASILREAYSEAEDGADYPNWLEARVKMIVDGLLGGDIELEGGVVDENSSLGSSVGFFPTDASTDLYDSDPTADGATPVRFGMGSVF